MGEANIFEKFNNLFGSEGLDGLRKDIESANSNTGDFVEVPKGEYEVKIVMILTATGRMSERLRVSGKPIWI